MNLNLELLTSDSEDLITSNNQTMITLSLSSKGFYFSKAACKLFGIKGGKYLHFARGKNEKKQYNGYWYFVVNDDEKGLKINNASHDACYVFSTAHTRLFILSTKKKKGDMFYLQNTGSELNGLPVVEILTNKTVQEILAQS